MHESTEPTQPKNVERTPPRCIGYLNSVKILKSNCILVSIASECSPKAALSASGRTARQAMEKFRQFFKGDEDPRISNATRHDFHEMILLSLLSSLCGGETCVDTAEFAAANKGFLRRFMCLTHGLPSHDSLSRLFRTMNSGPLAAALERFAAGWAKMLEEGGNQQIAIDDEALRRTYSQASELLPQQLFDAFAPESGIVLYQVANGESSNKVRVLPALIDLLDLRNAVVASDAPDTQSATTVLLIGKGGHFVLE